MYASFTECIKYKFTLVHTTFKAFMQPIKGKQDTWLIIFTLDLHISYMQELITGIHRIFGENVRVAEVVTFPIMS